MIDIEANIEKIEKVFNEGFWKYEPLTKEQALASWNNVRELFNKWQ